MAPLHMLRRGILLDQKFTSFLFIASSVQFLLLAACSFVENTEEKQLILFNNLERHVKTKSAQQKQNLKSRNTPRLPIVYTTADILQKLDYLAGIHGSKKAAIETAICELHRQAIIPVVCQHCGSEYADFTHEAEFIGWIGVCAKFVLVDGVEI